METAESQTSKRLLLKGHDNFIEWIKRFKAYAEIEEWGTFKDGKFIPKEGQAKAAKKWVVGNISDEAISPIDPTQPINVILDRLNEIFGYGNYSPSNQKQTIISMIQFPIGKDPNQVFLWLGKQLDILELCNGKSTVDFLRNVFEDGLSCTRGNSVFVENSDFWAEMRGRLNELDDQAFSDMSKIRQKIWKFWDARRNKKIKVDQTPFDPTIKLANALNATEFRSKRKCDYCLKWRKHLSKSHDTEKCFYGDVEGLNKKQANLLENGGNKSSSTYLAFPVFDSPSKIIYDTGCTPVSYFREKPRNMVDKHGSVLTASNETIPTYGVGEVEIGNLKLKDVVYVPQFKYNLLSGIQVMREGYSQIIEDGILKILDKSGKLLALGEYNPISGLIEMQTGNSFLVNAPEKNLHEWHKCLGHFNKNTITRNLRLNNIAFKNVSKDCEECISGKLTVSRKSQSNSKKSYDVLEMIESDSTPFPVESYDGFSHSLKFIDRKSGWISSVFVKKLNSATACEAFKIFKTRFENVTTRKIRYIRVDGGSEYKNVFQDFLTSHGIVKQITSPTHKHLPARAERAHRTVTELARSCHSDSKLPLKYYSDAQRYVVYTINRIIRDSEEKSPYEHIYGKAPDLNKLQSFGSICYVHVPKAKRLKGKLMDSGIRCRFLGYGDDDSLLEHKLGYKLLRELDRKIIFSPDVTFPENSEITFLEEPVDVDKFYSSLDKDQEDTVNNSKGHEVDSDDEMAEPKEIDPYKKLDDAISLGHIETRQPNNTSKVSIESLVNLCRNTELSISQFMCMSAAMHDDCPRTYQEAIQSKDKDGWKEAMDAEMSQMKRFDTWDIKAKPKDVNAVKSKWVFTKKYDRHGNVKKLKARFVAKGFSQIEGIDFVETYAPVLKFKSMRTLAAICAQLKLTAYQDDVPSAFLQGDLKETVWMSQPEGYNSKDSNEFCLLNKTIYGLKQSPREWNEVIHKFLIECGFIQSLADPCIYVNSQEKFKGRLIVGVYVDDIKTIGLPHHVEPFRNELRKKFSITEGGLLEWYLGIAFHQDTQGVIDLDQTVYLKQKLEEFKDYIDKEKASSPLPSNYQKLLQDAESETCDTTGFPYRRIVGSLMYAMLGTRPDLACSISVVSQFLEKPKPTHIKLVKQILKYVAGSLDYKLRYQTTSSMEIIGYVDASYANETEYQSRSGYGFMLAGGLISWYSGRQKITAQSSAESEYYAAVSAGNEAIWFRQLIDDMGFPQKTVTIYEDNQACISLTKNPEDHKRTKHIQVRFHVIRDYVAKELIKFVYCPTKDQLADVFTKGVSGCQLRNMMKNFGVSHFKSQGES